MPQMSFRSFLRLVESSCPTAAHRVQHIACILLSLLLRGGVVLEPEPPCCHADNGGSGVSPRGPPHAPPPATLHGIPDRCSRLAPASDAFGSSSKGLVHDLLPRLTLLVALEGQELKAR